MIGDDDWKFVLQVLVLMLGAVALSSQTSSLLQNERECVKFAFI
jgi:hypothetical protein